MEKASRVLRAQKKNQTIKRPRSVYLQMKTWGISANSHDAAIAVFENKELTYASHSERYSKVKNDGHLNVTMVDSLLEKYGTPDKIVWYEKPFLKSIRQLYAGQGFNFVENNITRYLDSFNLTSKIEYTGHLS